MDKSAVQRVLVSLGSSLLTGKTPLAVDRDLASRLLVQVAKEGGERAAIDLANDMRFVAQAWKPVLEDDMLKQTDPHRAMPYAEIMFALVNYTGYNLQDYGAFEQFGGADMVLTLPQLTAALRNYPFPKTNLSWDLVGFQDPPDQALVASDDQTYYLFKLATSPTSLRISELERGTDSEARREHEILVDSSLFASFAAGLLGDMLYWAARLRNHAEPGRDTWSRLNALLLPPQQHNSNSNAKSSPTARPASAAD
jgi:hypothetical protein